MLRHSFINRQRMRGTRGFTLVEVMVAVSVLAVVLISVYGVFGSVNAVKMQLDSDSDEYHMARVIFDRLGRELHGVYFRKNDETTVFRGGSNQQGQAFLELTTTAVTPLSASGTGIAEVRYRLETDMESDQEQQVLLRSEQPRQSLPAVTGDQMMRLAPGIESISLRFYAGGSWEDRWDARRNGLPRLVEVTLKVAGAETATSFRTTFDIPEVWL